MPKKRKKHEEIDLGKVSKILVVTNIDSKKVSQWNIVAKKYYKFSQTRKFYPARESKTSIL